MLEKIDVDLLMHEIRETVAREQSSKRGNGYTAQGGLSPIDKRHLPLGMSSPPLSLQPEFHARYDDVEYHTDDFLRYHGRDFLLNSYRAILRREPDPADLVRDMETLARGRFNKIDILASLRYSPEGEQAHVKIVGLASLRAIRRLGRLPLIGYLIQTLFAVGRLPILLRHQRQSEFYLLAQQQKTVDHDNQVHKQQAEALSQISAQTATAVENLSRQQQQLIEGLLREQQVAAARQIESNAVIQNRLTELRHYQTELRDYVDQAKVALVQHLQEQESQFARQVQEQVEDLRNRQQETHTELVQQKRRLGLLLEEARKPPMGAFDQSLSQLMAIEEEHLLDPLYASFEDRFRGDREEVKRRLRVYLPILKDAEVADDILDIGCGRGEWLEILKDEGWRGRGVDHNRVFVEQCRQSGFDVVEEDALVYLRSLPDDSLNVISSFHLVEHLPFAVLVKLLDEIVRTLRSGGFVILETPNPENFIVGTCSFYADPTHRNPIPSPTLQFLLESRGLRQTEVMKLRPWDTAKIEGDTEIVKRFNEYFYCAPDYGIIGWKG